MPDRPWRDLDGSPRERRGAPVHFGYGLLTLAYLVGLTWLSSIPRRPVVESPLIVEASLNILHIPLFGGLAFCLVKSITGGARRRVMTSGSWLAVSLFLVAFAAFNEWEQGFVPGRSCSLSDFLLDMVGIGSILLVYRIDALLTESR